MSALPSLRRRLLLASAAAAAAAVVSLASATPAVAAPSLGEIRGASAPGAIAGSYLVVLKSDAVGSATLSSRASALVNRYGGSVADVYGAAVIGFSAHMTAAQAQRLAVDSSVAWVEQDRVITLQATQNNPPSWGLDRIDQRNLPLSNSYTYPNTASNVHAYIIDTGIRITHTDFGGRASWGTNTAGGSNTDCHGHGTHVAGTVGGSSYGVAKGVLLVAVKVLNCAGSGTTTGVVNGINWVTANAIKPATANMSLGGGASSTLDNAVNNSINSGITYAIAAGNSGDNACNYSPARVGAAITVGATTINDAKPSWSNFGTCVDIFAPGENITSDWKSSNTATNTISGTSMATPHVTGAAALVLSANPSFSPSQVASALTGNATSGVLSGVGSGSPNLLLFVS